MSSPFVLPSPVPAELPDWVLALKPPDADLAASDSAVFTGLDAELEALMQAAPEDVTWLAESAEQTTQIVSRDQAAAILEGQVKPSAVLRPLPRPRRKLPTRLRQEEQLMLDALLVIMILTILAVFVLLRYLLTSP